MNSTSRRRSSITQLGRLRRAASVIQQPSISTNKYNRMGSIVQNIDQRLRWTYTGMINSQIREVISDSTMFPNQMLTQYIQYVYNTYDILDPVVKANMSKTSVVDETQFQYHTPHKRINNIEDRRTIDVTGSRFGSSRSPDGSGNPIDAISPERVDSQRTERPNKSTPGRK